MNIDPLCPAHHPNGRPCFICEQLALAREEGPLASASEV